MMLRGKLEKKGKNAIFLFLDPVFCITRAVLTFLHLGLSVSICG